MVSPNLAQLLMEKKLDRNILNRVRIPKVIVSDLLDSEVKALEIELGPESKGIANRILSLFVKNGNRIQLDENEVYEQLKDNSGVDEDAVCLIIGEMTYAGILRPTDRGRYEIANNTLAQQAYKKIEAENHFLKTIESTIRDRMGRNELLDEQYLNYITPSLHLLELQKKELEFIEISRRAIEKRKRIANNFRWGIFIALIALSSWAINRTINANKRYNELILAKEAVEEEQKKAEAAKIKADQSAVEAIALQQQADSLRLIAEASGLKAISDAELQRVLRRRASQLYDSITLVSKNLERNLAIMAILREEAEENAKYYNKLRKEAEDNEKLAEELKAKADKFNRIVSSRNVALRVLQIEDKDLKAQLALQIYGLNAALGDKNAPYHPLIFKMLYSSAKSLNKNLSFNKKAHKGSIRDLIVSEDGKKLYTTGSDGKVNEWTIKNWNPIGVPEVEIASFNLPDRQVYNTLAISKDERQLLVAGEMPYFQLLDTKTLQLKDSIAYWEEVQEIFGAGFLSNSSFAGFGKEKVYYYNKKDNQRIIIPKASSKTTSVVRVNRRSLPVNFSGKYEPALRAYKLDVEQFQRDTIQVDSFLFYGKRERVDFGKLTAVEINQGDTPGWMVGGFESGQIIILRTDLANWRSIGKYGVYKAHQAEITDITFSRNQKYLAICSLDGTVSVWDLERYQSPAYQPIIFDDHGGWAMSIAFSKDSDFLIVGCRDGGVYFWNLFPENYAETICRDLRPIPPQANYDRVEQEIWNRYFGLGFDQRAVCR